MHFASMRSKNPGVSPTRPPGTNNGLWTTPITTLFVHLATTVALTRNMSQQTADVLPPTSARTIAPSGKTIVPGPRTVDLNPAAIKVASEATAVETAAMTATDAVATATATAPAAAAMNVEPRPPKFPRFRSQAPRCASSVVWVLTLDPSGPPDLLRPEYFRYPKMSPSESWPATVEAIPTPRRSLPTSIPDLRHRCRRS
jgi:hypothetical protein